MTSNGPDQNTEKISVTQEDLDIDSKLAKTKCPFTWIPDWIERKIEPEHQEIFLQREDEQFQRIVDKQVYFPEFVFIYHLMQAFTKVMKNELPSAMECINQAEQSLADIKQKGQLRTVENVLQHVFIGTKCHALKKLGKLTELNELLKEICDVVDMNKTELAMLNGCQSRVLFFYRTDDLEKMNCARNAIEYEPNNSQWYFLMGQVCRAHRRKNLSLSQRPDEEEISAFKTAYQLKPNDLFGVSLAQLYRESGDFSMAKKIYKEVHALQPTSCSIRLRLALGLIRVNEGKEAKECLDYLAEKMPNSIRYEHYMGIYEEKCNGDPEAALPHYQKTTEKLNPVAEWQYVGCRKIVESDWDPLPYLLGLVKKYHGFGDHTIRDINIHIGSYYLFEKYDILSACQYLTKAIEIEPKNCGLKKHSLLFNLSKRVNLYHVLAKEVESALRSGATMYDDDKIAVLKNTLELCRKNCEDLPPYLAHLPPPSASRPQLSSSRFPRSNRNYDQGSSSRVENNWREERTSSSSLGFSPNYHPRRSNDGPNSNRRHFGSSHGRDYTSWRSEKRETQDNRNERHLSNIFNDKEDCASTDRIRGRNIGQPSSSEPRHKNDDSEAEASCYPTKTNKGLQH